MSGKSAGVTVWRINRRCPSCHAPVRLRNTALAIKLLEIALQDPDVGPDDVLQTYQCAKQFPDKSLCNELIYIRVRDWQRVAW